MSLTSYSYFSCRHSGMEHSKCPAKHFAVEEIEKAVFDALQPMLQMAAAQGKRFTKKTGKGTPADTLAQCRKDITETTYQERRCRQLKLDAYEEYISGTLSLKDYQDRKRDLTKQAKECSRRLEVLKAQEKAYSSGEIPHDVQAVTNTANQFRHSTSLTREMVTTFLESVYVYKDHYEFRWKDETVWKQMRERLADSDPLPSSAAESKNVPDSELSGPEP